MKTDIIICMGSSCFARGNKKIVGLIQEFIQKNKLEDRVNLRGNHCFGNCHRGPSVKINGELYDSINEDKIIFLLEKEFILNNN